MNEKVSVYVFDDKVFFPQFRAHWASNKLPRREVFGCKYEFEFADAFNALGEETARALGKTCEPVRSLQAYKKAIQTIRSFGDTDRAILFFDINLNETSGGFTITEDDISAHEMVLAVEFYCACKNAIADSVNTKDVVAWLNDQRQGFLLLIVAATHKSLANLEIYIASSAANDWESEILLELANRSSQYVFRKLHNSLTLDVNYKNLIHSVEKACESFAAEWWPSDGNIWVESNSPSIALKASASDLGKEHCLAQLEWFTEGCILVPHNHEDFMPQLTLYGTKHPLAVYLQNKFRLDACLVEKLLGQKDMYETLKRTIGGWALIHLGDNQGKRFSIQALVFAVAYAVADKQWLEELEWIAPQKEIDIDSARPLRELFGAVASLFKHLSTNQETKNFNLFDVRFVIRNEGPSTAITPTLHLEVDVDFDCISRTISSQSLMEKILFLKYACDGEAAKRVLKVTEVVSRYRLPIRLGIYPVSKSLRNCTSISEVESANWTRFDFSVK
ncbi:MAG: hypothetical protein KF752_09720 [Pirellulaceae bacterium]|nr:hypothetical protein [Pirellulaceae bacterium]